MPKDTELDRLLSKSVNQRAEINRFQRLVDNYKEPFWKEVKDRLEKWVENIEGIIDEKHMDLTESGLKALCAKKKALKDVIDIPEESRRALAAMMKQHVALQEKIRERRAKNRI